MDDLKNDIEKYLKGELSEARMHALEKQALDDPLLADALDGTSGIEGHDFAQDMTQLGQQLNARVNRKKVVPLWIWTARIAAGLLIIAVATYMIVSLQDSQQQPTNISFKSDEKTSESNDNAGDTLHVGPGGYLSMNDTKAGSKKTEAESAPVPSAPKPLSEIAPADAAAQAEQPIAEQETRRDEIAEAKPQAETASKSELAKRELSPAEVAPSATWREKKKGYIDTDAVKDRPIERKRASPLAGYSYSVKQDSVVQNATTTATQVVSGRVTSVDDGAGLPGVNVMIKGSSTGTVTDIRGNYQLPLSDPKTTLIFSFIGMESKEVPVSNDPIVNVSLNQDVAQLSEVVVVGYGESKEEDEKTFPTFDMAEPAGGKRAFKKYLEDRMVYPQEALDNKIEGKVTIQFTIETSGQVSNFNVIKGIGYGCDDELIRLIKEGPRWAPMKRDDEPVKGRVRVRMRFTLPKKK